jgi:hypothetical protein
VISSAHAPTILVLFAIMLSPEAEDVESQNIGLSISKILS